MVKGTAESVLRKVDWGQVQSEISPRPVTHGSPTDKQLPDPRPRSINDIRAGIEATGADWKDAYQLVHEAAAILHEASEEVHRVRGEAAEQIGQLRNELGETNKILRLTEEQLASYEKRYEEASAENAALRKQLGDAEQRRAALEQQVDADRRKISLLERIITDSKESNIAVEERASAAEEKARAVEGQLRELVATMRQKLPTARNGRRGAGAALALLAVSTLAGWFTLGQPEPAQARGVVAFEGVWGSACSEPSLVIRSDGVEFRDGLHGSLAGHLLGNAEAARFVAADQDDTRLVLVRYADDAVYVRAAVLSGVSVDIAQPILMRCSFAPADTPGGSAIS